MIKLKAGDIAPNFQSKDQINEEGKIEEVSQKVMPLVLLITDGMFLGGVERQIMELLKGLKRSGRYRTVLTVLDRGGALEAESETFAEAILPIRRSARFDITPALKLVHYARHNGVLLIHTFGLMSGLAGLLVARFLRLPIINNGIISDPPQLSFRHRIRRWTMRRANVIISNSQAGLQAYGLSQHPRTKVIHNGLDLKRFDGIMPVHDGNSRICMVANFHKGKDHIMVIHALEIILQTLPNVRLTLVGQEAGTLASSRRYVEELGLGKAVEFVTTTIHPEPYIAASQVCVLASPRNEGLSNAILEYMALGKPVVATVCNGNAELILQGKNGYLVPKNSPRELAERVVELLQNPNIAHKMGKIGQERVVKEFSLEKMVREYEKLYSNLLD